MSAPAFDHPALNSQVRFAGSSAASVQQRAVSTLAVWEMRARTRGDLKRLDVAQHADLGLTATDIRREVAKPFWRA